MNLGSLLANLIPSSGQKEERVQVQIVVRFWRPSRKRWHFISIGRLTLLSLFGPSFVSFPERTCFISVETAKVKIALRGGSEIFVPAAEIRRYLEAHVVEWPFVE